jgi:hypothetical protein
MHLPQVNYLAVLVSGVAIFILGGLWYSKALFAKRWTVLMGKSEADMKPAPGVMPILLLQAFICALITSWVLEVIINHFGLMSVLRGVGIGAFCWVGFTAVTSYANVIFAGKPRELWLIDSSYNLISFIIAGAILAAWR